MNSARHLARLSALAYLYDNFRDLPNWMRTLTNGQLEDLSHIMFIWNVKDENEILPLRESEKREMIRAITLLDGNVPAAAKALNIGKTTLYRKLAQWNYQGKDRTIVHQSAALERIPVSRGSRVF